MTLGAALLFLLFTAQDGDASLSPGTFHGRIEIPGRPLEVEVRLRRDGGEWRGAIDIPAQGARGLGLDVEVDGGRVRLRIEKIPGQPTFEGTVREGSIAGHFHQHRLSFAFRLDPGPLRRTPRPQEPRPPFPYRVEEVRYEHGGIRFAGTFTVPKGEGPFPAVFLVTGSGPQDRDETIADHKPFLVLADRLTRAGVAVLRVDDRGVGGTGGTIEDATTADFAEDALGAVEWLSGRPEVDAARIGLVGHSEGGIVTPIAAALDERVRFLVLLAPPGVPGVELLTRQHRLLAEGLALVGEARADYLRVSERIVRVAAAGLEREERMERLRRLAAEQMRLLRGGRDPDPARVEAAVRPLLTPWWRFFLRFDPRTALRKVQVPVLALWGGFDHQVDPEQNRPAVEAALAESGVEDRTLLVLPGLNHLFQTADTGLPAEYGRLEETFAPAALDAIADWIVERFGGARRR